MCFCIPKCNKYLDNNFLILQREDLHRSSLTIASTILHSTKWQYPSKSTSCLWIHSKHCCQSLAIWAEGPRSCAYKWQKMVHKVSGFRQLLVSVCLGSGNLWWFWWWHCQWQSPWWLINSFFWVKLSGLCLLSGRHSLDLQFKTP